MRGLIDAVVEPVRAESNEVAIRELLVRAAEALDAEIAVRGAPLQLAPNGAEFRPETLFHDLFQQKPAGQPVRRRQRHRVRCRAWL